MILTFLLSLGLAMAADVEHRLVWDLTVNDTHVGQQTVNIKYHRSGVNLRRVLETWTELNYEERRQSIQYRQRMTADLNGQYPAAFHSVVDVNGTRREVQARWTPASWWLTVITASRDRTAQVPIHRIDLSTADLLDPEAPRALGHYERVRLLISESGDVIEGVVKRLGSTTIKLGEESIVTTGLVLESAQGRSTFFYSADGYLVRFEIWLMGYAIKGLLTAPPPGGVDDFPVDIAQPKIDVIDLN